MIQNKVPPPRTALRKVLSLLGKRNRLLEMGVCLDLMKQAGYPPWSEDYESLIIAYTRNCRLEDAAKQIKVLFFLAHIRNSARNRRELSTIPNVATFESVLIRSQEMQQQKLPVSTHAYGCLIHAYSTAHKPELAEATLREMISVAYSLLSMLFSLFLLSSLSACMMFIRSSLFSYRLLLFF